MSPETGVDCRQKPFGKVVELLGEKNFTDSKLTRVLHTKKREMSTGEIGSPRGSVSNYDVVSASGSNAPDNTHFDRSSLRMLGRRYARKHKYAIPSSASAGATAIHLLTLGAKGRAKTANDHHSAAV